MGALGSRSSYLFVGNTHFPREPVNGKQFLYGHHFFQLYFEAAL
jgi:hypothetical protein